MGRAAELAQLHGLFELALQGERQVVFVTGEAGIGKTTLIHQFLAQIGGDDGRRWSARGQCVEHHGAGEPYLPLLDALGRLCRSVDGAPVIELLRQQAPTWLMHMPALVSAEDLTILRHRSAGITPAHMLRELAEALEVLTRDRVLVLVLEDLLWSDAATVEWLGAVARRPEPAKLLLIGTYRPVEVIVRGHPLRRLKQALQVHGLCEELSLRYLTQNAIAAYLAQQFRFETQDAMLCQDLARLVYQRTEGNPLFMVNVVKDWVRQEVLVEVAGQWTLRGRLDEVARSVPDNLRQLIDQQFEELDAEAQTLLETASVAGVRREQFIRAWGTDVGPNGTTVSRFEFRHALYQEVLSQRVPVSRCMRLHQRMEEQLAPEYGS